MYRKLRGKIKEVFDTQEAFAEAMGMNKAPIAQRLNGSVEWKVPEVAKACDLLHIPLTDAHIYFFNREV